MKDLLYIIVFTVIGFAVFAPHAKADLQTVCIMTEKGMVCTLVDVWHER
jgi:hypothetical protein